MDNTPIKAVLFDCDGVVADTMRDHAAAWVRAFRERGLFLDEDWVYEGEGMPTRELVRVFLDRANATMDDGVVGELGLFKERSFTEIHQPRIYPHIEDILGDIEKCGISTALVSGATRMALERALHPELIGRFQIVISADDVVQGKPSPEPYLRAARLLGVDAEDCLVIENAPMGIAAAKAAGMCCVALCTTLGADRLSKADVVVTDHAELMERLHALLTAFGDQDFLSGNVSLHKPQ